MKLPPNKTPPEKAPTYDKDRTLTKRTVKGAAGGMMGVDYEDERRPALGPSNNRKGRPVDGDTASIAEEYRAALSAEQQGSDHGAIQGYGPDPSRMILPDDDAAIAAGHAENRRKRRLVPRDRMTVDKDAPELRRRRSFDFDDETEDRDERSSEEQELEIYGDGVLRGGVAESRAHLFNPQDQREPGDLALTDPEDIQRALNSPAGYAKHSMILAEAFRRSTGATREEAIAYLGRMFVALKDRSFGRTALKEFGPASGILDLYPLEVIEHVLEHYPSFLPKVGFGRFFRHQVEDIAVLVTDTLTPLILEYPPELKIRGFAVRGGARPGYLFEPADEPGTYKLQINSPGRFNFLISSLSRTGYTMIERIDVLVKPARDTDTPAPPPPVIKREPEKIAAWPIPPPPAVDLRDALYATDAARAKKRADWLAELKINDALQRRPEIDLEVEESDAPIAHVLEEPSAEQTAPQPPPAPQKRSPPPPPPASRPTAPSTTAPMTPPKPSLTPPRGTSVRAPAPRAAAPSASAPIRRSVPAPVAKELPNKAEAIAKAKAIVAAASPVVAPPPRGETPQKQAHDEPTEAIPIAVIEGEVHDTASASAVEIRTAEIDVEGVDFESPSSGFADAAPADRTQPIRVSMIEGDEEEEELADADPDPTQALDQSTQTRTPNPPSSETRPAESISTPGTTSK